MGLDISVYRPVIVDENSPSCSRDEFVLDEHPELYAFSEFSFEKENEYYDLEAAAKNKGYNLDDLKWTMQYFKGNSIIYEYINKKGKVVKLKNPPIIKKTEKCILCEEVGYQRKGANKRFYEDGMWDAPCILDAKILREHWEKYFSFNTPDSVGGWGSCVELDFEDAEMKSRFKENIIDKFIEGETFVMYG